MGSATATTTSSIGFLRGQELNRRMHACQKSVSALSI